MPCYVYQNIESGETVEIIQSMNDEHVYRGKNGDEIGQWRRVYTVPRASIDTNIDPFDSKQFVEKTGNKKGTLGDMWERSAELSETREKKAGVDPVKQNFYADYKKKTGKEYMDLRPKKIETQGMTVDFSN